MNAYVLDFLNQEDHGAQATQALSVSEQLGKLAEGISSLDKEIHLQIVEHHDDLLSQATSLETLEGVLQMMQTRTCSLLSSMDRVRLKVTEPYSKIAVRTKQLRNLQETCDLLRRIIRIMFLCKRLRTQLQGGAREITKAAQSLNEFDYVCEGGDVSGVEVIEADRRVVKQVRKDVEAQALKILEQGIEAQNHTQVATALQVFYNLGSLHSIVERVINGFREDLHDNIRFCLNVQALSHAQGSSKGPGKAAMPAPGNTAAMRAKLWTNIEKLMDKIFAACTQIQHLQKVLIKKRDPTTHLCFMDELSKHANGDVDIIKQFWKSITSILTTELNDASEGSSFLKQTFEGEYPKILRLYNDLWRRLKQFSVHMSTSAEMTAPDETVVQDEFFVALSKKTVETYDPEAALKETLSIYENAYLSKSLSRLFDPINLVFSSSTLSPPTFEEVDNIVKTISSELNVASADMKLSVTVAKNVSKTIQLFCVKSEQLLCTDGAASQVIGAATSGQTKNMDIVNTLYKLHQDVRKVLSNMENYPATAVESVESSLQGVLVLIGAAVNPLFSSVSDALEAIILTMHQEDFSGHASSNATPGQCSLYMRELQGFVQRCHVDYFAPFHCQEFIMDSILTMVSRCIELFVRNASLIRPLGESGKLKLAADFAQMELAISPFCHRVANVGKPYKLLRAFKPLLFQTSEHLAKNPTIGEVIPYSTAIQLLFATAPSELKSPHVISEMSLSRYSKWLDDHPEENDRLLFIKGALEAYIRLVKQRQGKEYAPVYPAMIDLLQKGLKHHGAA